MGQLAPVQDNHDITALASSPLIADLVNQDLATLDRHHFIIFPPQLADSNDLEKDHYIFKQRNHQTWTCNVVGFLSDSTDELQIQSRFLNSHPKQAYQSDYFLRYMMQKVLHYNIINHRVDSSKQLGYYDLLVWLFPHYLNDALAKGVYKEYLQHTYNDAHVKGPVDIARHLKQNLPFIGKIAYQTREFSYDNKMNQLIRHTIEKVKQQYAFVLDKHDQRLQKNIRTIEHYTSSYTPSAKNEILQSNTLNPIRQSYYEAYASLQQLCLQILNNQKGGFGIHQNQVHGIVIDVAWLWEEYIARITNWQHYGRRKGLNVLYLFEHKHSPRYPDFIFQESSSQNLTIVDTKYKFSLDTRNDYNQMTTYLHVQQAKRGGFLQPYNPNRKNNKNSEGYHLIGKLKGGGEIFTYGFLIPQGCDSYAAFVEQIQQSEDRLLAQNFMNS